MARVRARPAVLNTHIPTNMFNQLVCFSFYTRKHRLIGIIREIVNVGFVVCAILIVVLSDLFSPSGDASSRGLHVVQQLHRILSI